MQQLFQVLSDFEDLASYTPASVGESKEWAAIQKNTGRIAARLFLRKHYSAHCMAHIQANRNVLEACTQPGQTNQGDGFKEVRSSDESLRP
jgi:hypothetical protein